MSSRAPAGGEGTAHALAEEAYELVQTDPQRARAIATRALGAARADGDGRAEVAALHALSWTQHVLGDVSAEGTAREGIRIGTRIGDRRGVALLRRRLALTLAFAGKARGARREIDTAIADLSALDAARSEVFRLAIHRRAHEVDLARHRAVLAGAASALRRLRREDDGIWEARVLYNRGLLFLDRGEFEAAAADLDRARSIYGGLGARAAADDATLAGAEVALQRGDLVEYLRVTDELHASLPSGELELGIIGLRPFAFAQLRLLGEAQAAATAYLALCLATGRGDYASDALVDLARIAILCGDAPTAMESAMKAARSFTARGKPVSAALARGVALRARLLDGTVRSSSIVSALGIAETLERAGWRRDALRARTLAARVALAAGATSTAREQLHLAQPLARRGTLLDRIELGHVGALMCVSDGNDAGAKRALRSALDLLDDYRAGFGAAELRAAASSVGGELFELAVRLAARSGDPTEILTWAERLRAAALRLPAVRPPVDPELRVHQAELRTLALRARQAERRGIADRGLAARQAQAEAAIRSRLRHVRGDGAPPAADAQATRLLGDRALVEYVAVDGELLGVTLRDGRLALHKLNAHDAEIELEWLRFSLRQLVRQGTSTRQRVAARANARAAAGALDRQLVAPLLEAIGDAPLVIVPTGPLHALPWAALPSMRGRPIVIAPSLSLWCDLAGRRPSRRRRVAFVAGPRLRHARREIEGLAPLYARATVLHGAGATVGDAVAAFDGAALAHVACHGLFRADSPLFSSLELADGPLTALDLQQLERVPETLILSSCDLALSERHPGDELLGFSAALLAMGTRTIVASVVPIPDAAARRMMLAFHRALVAGSSPSVALAQAHAGLRADLTTLAGFVCLGSG